MVLKRFIASNHYFDTRRVKGIRRCRSQLLWTSNQQQTLELQDQAHRAEN